MTGEQRSALSEQFAKASRIAGAEPVAVVGHRLPIPRRRRTAPTATGSC